MFGFQEAHCQKHHIALNNLFAASEFHLRTASVGCGNPLNLLNLNASELTFGVADEAVRCQAPAALAAFLVACCGFQNHGPPRPRCGGVSANGRFGHNLNLRHAHSPLTVAGSDAVRASVAAANHKHALAFGRDGLRVGEFLSRKALVLLRQNLESEINALQIAAFNLQIAGRGGSCGNHVSVETSGQLVQINRCIELKLNAFLLHKVGAARNHILVELEVRNAVAQKASRVAAAVENGDRIAAAVELHGCRQTCRSSADDGNLLAVARILFGGYKTLAESFFNYRALVLADCHRRVDAVVEHAALLAKRGADAACEFRKVVSC